MKGALYDLFRNCIVRLKTPNNQGTGFFVGPGLILTCDHVVANAITEDIEISWQHHNTIHPTSIQHATVENIDLALLKVPILDHPCVYLDNEAEPGHNLYSFGYANQEHNGDSITVICEGPSNNSQLLTIKDENIRPGFSGAPLLNQRTYKVCGIIKSERQARVAPGILRRLGGQAIPTTLVLQQFPELEAFNRKFHRGDKRWEQHIRHNLNLKATEAPHCFNCPSREHTKLIGRKKELDTLLERISAKWRTHITIIDGIGGVGKTALALEAAHLCWEAKQHRNTDSTIPIFDVIIFTSAKENYLKPTGILLRPQREPTLQSIFQTISITLDIKRTTHIAKNKQFRHINEGLRRQSTLLIVDNFEAIDDKEKDDVLAFLEQVPHPTQVIVTTRELIGRAAIRLDCLTKDDSLQLIREQAELQKIQLGEKESERIYNRCHGIPIAMVYLVGQKAMGYSLNRILSPQTPLPEDIGHFCFEGSITPLKGQASHQLLMSFAMFPSSPTWDAIAQVSGLRGDPIAVDKAIAQLKRLSLISEPETRRYRMIPVTREYAASELDNHPDFESTAREHWLGWYKTFTKRWGGNDWDDWCSRYDHLKIEWNNIHAVLQWCAAQDRYQDVIQLWRNIDNYVDLSGDWQIRLQWWRWLARRSKRHADLPTFVEALSEQGWTLILIGGKENRKKAFECLMEAWELRQEAAFDIQAHLANHLAIFHITQNQYQAGFQWLDDEENLLAQTNLEQRDFHRHQLQILYYRAEIYFFGENYGRAAQLLQQVVDEGKKIGWQRFANYAQNRLADIAIFQGDLSTASQLIMTGYQVARASKEKRRIAHYQFSYARLEQARGNREKAHQLASQALQGFKGEKVAHHIKQVQAFLESNL